MEISENKQSLKDKWKIFVYIIFDPWILVLILSTIVFIYYSTLNVDKNLLAIISLIISLFSGLLGGIITNNLAQMTELKVLVARGNSAIRSLKLILLNISNIEKRVKVYISCTDKENVEYKLISSNFEEIIEKCNILEEEIISSIENWTDIIPEVANLKTQIGLVSEMKFNRTELENDIILLNKKIESIKEEESKQKDDLYKKLSDKEVELVNTKHKLREAENKINITPLSGLTSLPLATGTFSNVYTSNLLNNVCPQCGKYNSNTKLFASGICLDCYSRSGISITAKK